MLVLETLRFKVLENLTVSKAHNTKPLLALLKWPGPSKSEGTEGDDEVKEAVQECHSFPKGVAGQHKAWRGVP
jgi:hypothetical protein